MSLRNFGYLFALCCVLTAGSYVLGTRVATEKVRTEGANPVVQAVDSLETVVDSLRGVVGEQRRMLDYSEEYRIPADLSASILQAANAEDVPIGIAFRLVQVESSFRQRAVSHVGAVGYTQIKPSTARIYRQGITRDSLFSRPINLRLGFRYLRDLFVRFGSWHRALMAYHRGPTRLAQEIKDKSGHGTSVRYSGRVLETY